MKNKSLMFLPMAALLVSVQQTVTLAQESPASSEPAKVPAVDEPILPPLDPAAAEKAIKPVPALANNANDPMNLSVAMDENFQDLPLAGVSLILDRRSKASEAAQQWEKEQKNALQAGVQIVGGLTTPDADGLRSKLNKFIGKKPMVYGDLQEMVQIIQDHYRSHNRPMTHVYIPKQSLYSDRLVLSIVEGRVGKTVILTEADVLAKSEVQRTAAEKAFISRMDAEKSWWKSWYNTPYKAEDVNHEFLPRTSQLEGKIVDTQEIKAQISGMNRSPWVRLNRPVDHPFRDVSVNFSQPDKDVLGTTNLVFEVNDRRPLKFFTGIDNGLTEATGADRLFLGAAWYDAFMLGQNHQLGAQVFSSLDPEELLGLSTNYQIPWQNTKADQFTELFLSYVTSQSSVSLGGVNTDAIGNSLGFGARHYFELPELFGAVDLTKPLLDDNPYAWARKRREAFGLHHEFGLGLDYKQADNNLEFGGSTVAESPADVVQFVLEYNARQTDPTGESGMAAQFFVSPGDLSKNNTDEAYSPLRRDAEASYMYVRTKMDREQDLPFFGMTSKLGITAQYASCNLLASEQIGLGGYSSARGYPERALRGDIGWIGNLELYTPEFYPCRDWFGWTQQDTLSFLTFLDYAHGESVDESSADPLDNSVDLMSTGLGIRYEFEDSLKLRLDYGFRLEDLPKAANNEDDGAVHFGLIYVF